MSGLVSKWATDESLVQEALKQDSLSHTHKADSLEDSKWNKPITSKASEPLISKWANVKDEEEEEEEAEEQPRKHIVKESHNSPSTPRTPKTPKTPRRRNSHQSSYPTPPTSAEIDHTNPLAQRLDMLNLGRVKQTSKVNETSRSGRDNNHHDNHNDKYHRGGDRHSNNHIERTPIHRRDLESIRDNGHHHSYKDNHKYNHKRDIPKGPNHRDNHKREHGGNNNNNNNRGGGGGGSHGHQNTNTTPNNDKKLKQELEVQDKEKEEREKQEFLKKLEEWEAQDLDWASLDD